MNQLSIKVRELVSLPNRFSIIREMCRKYPGLFLGKPWVTEVSGPGKSWVVDFPKALNEATLEDLTRLTQKEFLSLKGSGKGGLHVLEDHGIVLIGGKITAKNQTLVCDLKFSGQIAHRLEQASIMTVSQLSRRSESWFLATFSQWLGTRDLIEIRYRLSQYDCGLVSDIGYLTLPKDSAEFWYQRLIHTEEFSDRPPVEFDRLFADIELTNRTVDLSLDQIRFALTGFKSE